MKKFTYILFDPKLIIFHVASRTQGCLIYRKATFLSLVARYRKFSQNINSQSIQRLHNLSSRRRVESRGATALVEARRSAERSISRKSGGREAARESRRGSLNMVRERSRVLGIGKPTTSATRETRGSREAREARRRSTANTGGRTLSKVSK